MDTDTPMDMVIAILMEKVIKTITVKETTAIPSIICD